MGYQQNPHLDTRLRGRRAASIMARTLRGEIKPVQVIVKPPMVYNIIFQNTYAEPLLPITKASMDLEKSNPKVLAATVMGGYQYGDVPYMGPSVVVVTDGDRRLAEKEAKRFGDMLWADARSHRPEDPGSCRCGERSDGCHEVSCRACSTRGTT